MPSAGIPFGPLPDVPGSPHSTPESIVIYLSFSSCSPVTPMRVLASESIASVKLRIQTWKGFVVKKQKLIFDGRELARNNCLIGDYGVGNGHILHLILRLNDLRLITVKTTFGREYRFQVQQSRNVGYIKQQIAHRERALDNLHEQKLICNGEELEDQRLIEDISTNKDAVIHLLIHRSAKVRTTPDEEGFELSVEASSADPVTMTPKIELPSAITNLIGTTAAGLVKGNPPVRSSEGSGGAYLMQDASGLRFAAVFKPADEEPMAANNPSSFPCQEMGALREVAAYLLDHPVSGRRAFTGVDFGFSGVPPTVLVRCLHEGFNHPEGYKQAPENMKIGSLQMFVDSIGNCEDMGPRAFPVEEVHKISVLDIRLANADRHGGNILFEDCTFEWLYWPQAQEPYDVKTAEYIKSLDAEEDIALLRFHGWELSLECARTLRISTMLLKKGSIMCRETLRKRSVIEEIIHEATRSVLPGSTETTFMECISEIMDRRLELLPK
ncbi:unnamed protein product [Spirodela intermedia]|uniref:1-phosphatidylinositol 4-kinase n=1 Tax=Spirodela intermedia TaxID=51605 RepID=A0A7I8IU07_SPIIN|nr:unnamed protein product [Spirodela intermedia]CAA6661109.1 unnamed protein product [Spirodela intermedia]